jgi:lysylphosphatidylglycerol synthetase-like protein (DUF2156 family)
MTGTAKPAVAIAALAACTLVAVAIGGYAYAHTPAGVPVAIHFDLSGHPNGWASRGWAFFGIPLIGVVLAVLQWRVPALKPSAGPGERKLVSVLMVATALALLAGQAEIAWHALGHPG